MLEMVPVPVPLGEYVEVTSPAAFDFDKEVFGHRDDGNVMEQLADRLEAGVEATAEPSELLTFTCSNAAGVAPDTLPAGGTVATEVPFGS